MLKTKKSIKKYAFISPKDRPKVKGEKLEPTKTTLFTFKKTTNPPIEKTVCLYVKEDCSQSNAIEKHVTNQNITFLHYDDLGITWNFSYFEGRLIFHTASENIIPKGIYNRPHYPPSSHPRLYMYNHLFRALECWDGLLIGAGMFHFHNSSKGYQLAHTIRTALKKSKINKIKIPETFFIKGVKQYKKLIRHRKDLIVKSSSGIRSEVAVYEKFQNWETNNINYLPALFQQTCYGPDIRIHWMKEKYWPIILYQKEGSIDYRYAPKKSKFEILSPLDETLKNFCAHLARIEKLHLIGVDLIQVGRLFYCLESNPNPGWAGFHRPSGKEPELAQTLIKKLSQDHETTYLF